jgi:hypothetical protein
MHSLFSEILFAHFPDSGKPIVGKPTATGTGVRETVVSGPGGGSSPDTRTVEEVLRDIFALAEKMRRMP